MAYLPDAYSYPPRGMDRIAAARYVGVGVTKFDEMVEAREMPKPKLVGRRRIWDRIELDMCFTDLPSGGERVNEIDAILARRKA